MRHYFYILIFFLLSYTNIVLADTGNHYLKKYVLLQNTSCIDSACVDSMFLWLYYVQSKDVVLGDTMSNKFVQYANTKTNDYLRAKAYLLKAVVANAQGNVIEAIPFALTSIKYFHDQPSIDYCFAYQNLSAAYNKAGNYVLARESNKKALAAAEALKDKVLMSNSYNSIGISYNQDKQYKEAIPWFRKVIDLNKYFSKPTATGYQNLGLCFRYLRQYDSAFVYAKKGLLIAEKQNSKKYIAYSLYDIAAIFIEIKQYDTAIVYLQKSATIYESINEKSNLVYVYSYLGQCYTAKDNKQLAQNYYQKALTLIEFNKSIKQQYEVYYNLGEMFFKFKEFDSAYYYNQKHTILLDSTLRAKSILSTSALIASYQLDEKENKIQLLQHKNNLNRIIVFVVILALLFLLALILWLYNRNKYRVKKQELLTIQTLQKERERIARDLHDNVGGLLSFIIYTIDGINEDDKEKRSIVKESINQSVLSIIGSLRETIWAISDANINIQSFSDKLKIYTRNLFKHSNTKIKITENITADKNLNTLLGLNLYRICQEILTNAFKYANATEVTITFLNIENKLSIKIEDNGIGFDVTKNDKERYGLQNIKKRAEEFGISLTLESEINKGTRYLILV